MLRRVTRRMVKTRQEANGGEAREREETNTDASATWRSGKLLSDGGRDGGDVPYVIESIAVSLSAIM